MTHPTKREVQRALEDVRDEPADASTAMTVNWRDAAPDARPDGIAYDDDAGTLTYDLWTAQRDCLDALIGGEADIVAFLGGYGSGKSIVGARWLIAQALAHPGSRFLAMGTDFAKARTTTYRVLFEQLPGDRTAKRTSSLNGPEQSPIVADYNKRDHRLTFTNDTEVVLGSADDWKRFAGAEFGGIWLDEPSHYQADLHDLLEMLGGRLRGVDGPKVQCWTLTGNGYNDAWEILAQRQDKTGDPIGLDIELNRASTLDNPYLDDGAVERFTRQYGDTAREGQALEGTFQAAQGLVYTSFSREDHVIPHGEARERVVDDWRMYGYDDGWADPSVLLEIGKTDYGQLLVLDAFYETKAHVTEVIEWLDDKSTTGPIYAEHEPAHITRFKQAGYRACNAEKSIDAGIADVRRRLETDAAGRVGLLVSARCESLIHEFLGYKEDHVGTTRADDHCLDALRYAIHTSSARRKGPHWGTSTRQSSSSGGMATVQKTGSDRARRRDRHRSQSSGPRLNRPRTIDGVRRRQSR